MTISITRINWSVYDPSVLKFNVREKTDSFNLLFLEMPRWGVHKNEDIRNNGQNGQLSTVTTILFQY